MLVRCLLIVMAWWSGMQMVSAAEWTVEPALALATSYSDNVGMRSSNEQSSTAYSVSPRVELKGQEPNWDVGMSALVRATRYNNVENVDSDNYFLNLANGYSTERQLFRLDGSLSRNTNYDNNFNTELPNAGLVDDRTVRKTTHITPSWRWNTSESSSLSVSLDSSDIKYDEVSSTAYRDYRVDTATLKSIWNMGVRSQLGFTLSYSDYQNEKQTITVVTQDYSQYFEYQNSVYQLDYIYRPSETSQLNLSLGTRKIDSTKHSWPVSCVLANPFTGECVIPVLEDVHGSDDGTVASFNYSRSGEISSISFGASRIVVPSSFGGAQEQEQATIRYARNISERFKTELLLDARQITSIDGLDTSNDRKRQRIEPKFIWKMAKHWSLEMSYRFIKQNLTAIDTDSESNAIYVNLNMRWPRLASTY